MQMNMTIEQLTVLFQKLGIDDPQGVAASQMNEGIPHLHRYLFLTKAWQAVVSEADINWPERTAALEDKGSTHPFAGVSHALQSMLEKGVGSEDIIDLVRGMQAQLLFELCYLLGDPSHEDEAFEGINWALFAVDDDFQPIQTIDGLNEDVLATDPTNREMRPRLT